MLYGFALTWMVKSKSIALFFHIFVHIKSLCWKFFWPHPPLSAIVSIWLTPPPPLVSNGQLLANPPSPPRQQWSAFGLPPLPPPAADVICERPLIGIRNYGKSSHDYYASFVVFDDGIPSCDDVSSLFLHLKFMMTFHHVMTFHNMMIAHHMMIFHHDDMN